MIADLLNLAGYMLPNPKEFARTEGKRTYKKIPKCLIYNKAALPQNLSNDEKAKHQFYVQKQADDVLIRISLIYSIKLALTIVFFENRNFCLQLSMC